MKETILVTGASGFLGGHLCLALLQHGYSVRGSVRDKAKAQTLRDALTAAGADVARLEICELDLLHDKGWREAASGCHYLQHVASPFVTTMPKDENDLIRPAVEGTRRAVQAALDAGMERIVLTSSVAALDSGHRDYTRTLGPKDWSDLDGPKVTAYIKSKTRAEQEAWSLVQQAGAREKLAVINPGTMLGPLLDDDPGTSGAIIQRMLRGDMPMLPGLILPWVDVRDVAAAQVAAMTSPLAAGQRTILTNPAQPLLEIAEMLRAKFAESAAKVPRRQMPHWLAMFVSLFDKSLRDGKTYLGVPRHYDAATGVALLGRPLRITEEALTAMAESLIKRGLCA